MSAKQFNPAISIIRVLAMMSIIVGHWLTMKGINHYQLGAIGVQIFLFISGWLQSGKNVSNARKWLIDKWKRIMIPYYIVLAIVAVIMFFCSLEIRPDALLVMILNLQGIGGVLKFITPPVITGYGQTWFLTVLSICYLLTLFLKYHPRIEQWIRRHLFITFGAVFFLQIAMAFCYIQIGGLICFFLGYFWNHESPCSGKKYGYLTAAMLLMTALRFVAHIFFDGTQLYDSIVFTWSFNILGVWITITMMLICNKYKGYSLRVATSKIWRFLDLASYPLFLSHYFLMKGELSVEKWIHSSLFQAMVISVVTVSVTLIVLALSDFNKLKGIFFCEKRKNRE